MSRTETAMTAPATLYADTAAPGGATPRLDGDRRAAVTVVGGGFTGLSTALHLAEQGVDVVVLEGGDVGWGASGRNGGQVNPGLKPDPDEIERRFGRDLGGRMIALAYGAPDLVFDLIRRHGIACEARRGGTLRAAVGPAGARSVMASAAQCERRGMPVDLLDAAACRHATGTRRYWGGLLDRRGGSVNPLAYARGLAAAATGAGATIHGGTRAIRLRRHSAAWAVETATGTLTSDHLVLATNGYTDGLWPGLRRTIVPVHSAITCTAPLPAPVAASILPGAAVLYEVGHLTTYFRLDPAGRLLMGGRARQRPVRSQADVEHLARYARTLFPALGDAAWTHRWSGQVAVTADHLPHLHEPEAGILMALGYNGRGVAMATAMGALLARRIMGTPAATLDMPVTAGARPFPLHGLWPLGVEAMVAYGRLRDRIDSRASLSK